MKVSMAALSFLILAAALGSRARVIRDSKIREVLRAKHQSESPTIQVFHQPADCCPSYTTRRIRCSNFKTYFATGSECSQPGVIFITKRGQYVCANPSDLRIQNCMANLRVTQ